MGAYQKIENKNQEFLTFNVHKAVYTVPEVNKDHDSNLGNVFSVSSPVYIGSWELNVSML